jgi:hypothetical protein
MWFVGIRPGDTPEKNLHAKLAREWAAEWLERMRVAFGAQMATA